MKRNKLTILIALLLLGAMLLASCDSEPKGPSEPPLFNEVENDYSEAISAWAEYLSYVAPEKAPVYKATAVLSGITGADGTTDELIVIVDETENFKTVTPEAPAEGTEPQEPEEVHVSTTKTIKWYNKNTGALVKTLTELTAETFDVEGTRKYDETVKPTELVKYAIEYDDYNLIKVEATTLTLKEVEEVEGAEPVVIDTQAVDSYEEKTVISYYYADGTLFLENLEDELRWRPVANAVASNAGRYLLDSEELAKTFLMDDGELVREFGYRMEYNVPVYDKDSQTYTWDSQGLSGSMVKNADDYAYLEFGGNKYVITEEIPVTIPLGDLTMFLVQGMTLSVTDKDDKALAYYETECYGITGYAILSNGNVYICEFELLNSDAEEYDISTGNEKLNVHHKIINVTDGSVTELDLGFKTSKLFNNTTKEINSFLNYTTLEITDLSNPTGALLESAEVKSGYILAEIQKYEGGVLDGDTTWAVLDESFNIVKELPAIVADQFSYPSFMDADTMIVSAKTVGSELIYYGADLKSGEISLLPDFTALNNVQLLDNGYFWNNKVYDKDWNVLRTLKGDTTSSSYTVYGGFRVINGDLYYYTYSSSLSSVPSNFDWTRLEIVATERTEYFYDWDEEKKEQVETKEVYIDYSTETETVVEDAVFLYDNVFFAVESGDDTYYNINGDVIIAEDEYDKYIESELLDRTVRYEVTKTVSGFTPIEDGYLVRVTLAYKNDTTTTTEESGIPQTFEEYEYYIIK